MNKILAMLFIFLLLNNIVLAQDYRYQRNVINPVGYNVDINRLRREQQRNQINQSYAFNAGLTKNPPDQAQMLLDNALTNYQVNVANQVGVPYEEYVCNGDYVCMQRIRMQQQYINAMNSYSRALQNQHMTIDANVKHSGTVNLNNYNYNRYRY